MTALASWSPGALEACEAADDAASDRARRRIFSGRGRSRCRCVVGCICLAHGQADIVVGDSASTKFSKDPIRRLEIRQEPDDDSRSSLRSCS